MSNAKVLAHNFFSLLSLRGFQFLIPLLTIPYLLRSIGIENYGLLAFASAFALYSGAFVQYGFAITATRDLARIKHNPEELGQRVSEVLSASLTLSLFAFIVSATIIFIVPQFRENCELFLLCLLQSILQSLFPSWLFQGLERMPLITSLILISRLVFLIGLFTFISSPEDYILLPILNIGTAFLLLTCTMLVITNNLKIMLRWPSASSVVSILKAGRHAFISQLAPTLYNTSSTFILGIFETPSMVGVYSAASKVIDAVASLGYVISSVFIPRLSCNPEKHGLLKNIMFWLGLLITLVLVLASEEIGFFLYPIEHKEFSNVLLLMSPSVLAIFMILTFNGNYLMLQNKENIAAKITLYVSVFFFLAALFLIPNFMIWGSVVTLVGARFVMAIILYITYKKN